MIDPMTRTAYCEAVWDSFVAKRGPGPLVMSPMDYSLICEWLDRGIPLFVILRSIDDCAGRGRTLAYFKLAVEEEIARWQKTKTL